MFSHPVQRCCALLLLLLAGRSVCAQHAEKAGERHKSPPSTAYIRQSDRAFVTDNNQFEFANVLRDNGSGYLRLLILKSIHNEHIDGREETSGRVNVEAWTIWHDGRRTPRWKFSVDGNEGEALHSERFFRVSAWGCCSWPSVHSYFSLLTGTKLYVTNEDLLEVSASEGGPHAARYIAFGVHAHNVPALLQYGTDTKLLQRFSLISPRKPEDRPRVFLYSGSVSDTSLVLAAPFNFSIVLKYSDGVELRVPVENDAIQMEKTKLPAGYSLRQESTSWSEER